jgi:hypothetical protein
MTRRLFSAAFLVSLILVTSGAIAQERNEIAVTFGRSFVSDQTVNGVPSFDTTLRFGNRFTLEGDYGRRLVNFGIVGLTAEVPFTITFHQDVVFPVNLIPKNYQAFFVTPALRANLFPGAGISPWVSVGGGVGHFNENSTLEFGGPNPGETGTTTGVFQAGVGLDVRLWRNFGIRGEARDFYSGVPQLNVDTGRSRQHNYLVGGGVVWHF